MSQAPTSKSSEEPFSEPLRLVDECLPHRADDSPDADHEKSGVMHGAAQPDRTIPLDMFALV